MGPLRRVLITASVAGCILAGANASAALAATYKVNSTADTGGTCSPAPASCTLRQASNSATGGGSGGGADVTAGVGTLTVNIADSTFSLNKAGPSGGNGGGLDAEGGTGASTVNVTRSTFSSNTADSNGDGGALYFSGG